jgi:hypothetical protein
MSDTVEKLKEATYFLSRLQDTRSDREVFKFNLSAFLSAARSVTFYAQKEFKRAPGFEEWYATKQDEMGADPAMRFFLDSRNKVLKQKHIPTGAQINVTVTDTLNIAPNVSAELIRRDGIKEALDLVDEQEASRPSAPKKSGTTVEWVWHFEDLPDGVDKKEVVTLCAEHVAKLRVFVEQCETKFPAAP